ncbi:MAG: phospholipase D family protein [Burkholderiaceae bacterium]|nr:phospholipase D family protein [Burkholderiaceae bacterium]
MPVISSSRRWLFLAALLALLQGCATLPPPAQREPSTAMPAQAGIELADLAAQSIPPGSPSAFRPLPLSAWSMEARLTLVRHARQSLDIQYYLLQNDMTGHALLRAVRDAAGRGVRVRILVDDLYTHKSDRMLLSLEAYPNIEVRLYNPFPAGRSFSWSRWVFALSDFARVNHRMHNKLLIADGAFAVAGGRNIADEYFFSSKEGNFVDFDLLVAGQAVPQLAAIFDRYWNSPRVYQLKQLEPERATPEAARAEFDAMSMDARDAFPPLAPDKVDLVGFHGLGNDIATPPLKMLGGSIEVFSDDPEKASGRSEKIEDPATVTSRVIRAIADARTEVVAASPYFVPGERGMRGLSAVREKNVRVEIITNSLASNDEPFVTAAYAQYRVPLLKEGVDIYETDSSQLKHNKIIGAALRASIGRSHSKLIVIDQHLTFVGSMNLDFRSSRLNTELGMLVESPELAADVLKLKDVVRAGSYRLRLAPDGKHVQWVGSEDDKEVVYDDEPGEDLGTKIEVWLLSPFISESLL